MLFCVGFPAPLLEEVSITMVQNQTFETDRSFRVWPDEVTMEELLFKNDPTR